MMGVLSLTLGRFFFFLPRPLTVGDLTNEIGARELGDENKMGGGTVVRVAGAAQQGRSSFFSTFERCFLSFGEWDCVAFVH